jgi:hypothetical protein
MRLSARIKTRLYLFLNDEALRRGTTMTSALEQILAEHQKGTA